MIPGGGIYSSMSMISTLINTTIGLSVMKNDSKHMIEHGSGIFSQSFSVSGLFDSLIRLAPVGVFWSDSVIDESAKTWSAGSLKSKTCTGSAKTDDANDDVARASKLLMHLSIE